MPDSGGTMPDNPTPAPPPEEEAVARALFDLRDDDEAEWNSGVSELHRMEARAALAALAPFRAAERAAAWEEGRETACREADFLAKSAQPAPGQPADCSTPDSALLYGRRQYAEAVAMLGRRIPNPHRPETT